MPFDQYKTSAQSLVRIMEAQEGEFHNWGPEELDIMLLHQLAAPLQFDMELASGELARKLMDYCASGKPLPNRFCDLLFSSTPPIELLDLTKQFAKANRGHPDSLMQKIASVLYYATCLVAKMRCGQSITQLSDAELRSGVEWVRAQSWIDPKTRALFDEAAKFLAGMR